MRIGKHLLIGFMALLMLGGALSPSAFAWGHKHRALPKHHGHTHYKKGPYADMLGSHKAPKVQHAKKHTHWNR